MGFNSAFKELTLPFLTIHCFVFSTVPLSFIPLSSLPIIYLLIFHLLSLSLRSILPCFTFTKQMNRMLYTY